LPTCQNCGRKWSWKDTITQIFRIKLRCPYCEGVQYLSAKSRVRASLLYLPVLIIQFFLLTSHLSYSSIIGINVILLALATVHMPFIY
jgi:CXXC-20-CXXC protein